MTSIGTVAFAPQEATSAAKTLSGALQAYRGAVQAAGGDTSRDAQIADLPATSAAVNQLQSLATASSPSASAASAVSASPAPSLPTTQQQTQAQQAAAQPPLKGDFYADGDDAE